MLTKILTSTLVAGGVLYLYSGNKASAANNLQKQKYKGHPGLKDWNSFFFKW